MLLVAQKQRRMTERLVNNDLERMWKEAILAELTYSSGICLAGTEKTHGRFESGYPVSGPIFECGVPLIRSTIANHSTATFCVFKLVRFNVF
jgi:hypothetical protein